jgi:hypothetical protein
MDETTGNLQERLDSWKFWLAAFFDSEGSLILNKGIKNNKGSGLRITPIAHITNGNVSMINVGANVLRAIGVGFSISSKPDGTFMLWISGIKRMKKFLDILYPLLISKKYVADVVLGFCNSRLGNDNPKSRYTFEEIQMYQKCRDANRENGSKIPRDYMPTLLKFDGMDDIVRTDWKPVRGGGNGHPLRFKVELIK